MARTLEEVMRESKAGCKTKSRVVVTHPGFTCGIYMQRVSIGILLMQHRKLTC